MPTPEELLRMGRQWVGRRRDTLIKRDCERVLESNDATEVQRLEAIRTYAQQCPTQPLALLQWIDERLEEIEHTKAAS